MIPKAEEAAADARRYNQYLIADTLPLNWADIRLTLDETYALLNQLQGDIVRQTASFNWVTLDKPAHGSIFIAYKPPGLERFPADGYLWSQMNSKLWKFSPASKMDQHIEIYVTINGLSGPVAMTRRLTTLVSSPELPQVVLLHYLHTKPEDNQLIEVGINSDQQQRMQYALLGYQPGWVDLSPPRQSNFPAGRGTLAPRQGSLLAINGSMYPSQHQSSNPNVATLAALRKTKTAPPSAQANKSMPNIVNRAPAAPPAATATPQRLPTLHSTNQPGPMPLPLDAHVEHYTEVEASLSRFKRNQDFMDELLLPFDGKPIIPPSTLTKEQADESISRLINKKREIEKEIEELQSSHGAKLQRIERHSSDTSKLLQRLAASQTPEETVQVQQLLESELGVVFVPKKGPVREVAKDQTNFILV